MQLKVFAVPAQGGEEAVEEMNKFLRSHRVLSIEKRMVEQGGAYWFQPQRGFVSKPRVARNSLPWDDGIAMAFNPTGVVSWDVW